MKNTSSKKSYKFAGSMIFLFYTLFTLFLVFSSHAATYYYKNKYGVPIYTNIPPAEQGYKLVILPESAYKTSRKKSSLGVFKYSKIYDDDINKTAEKYDIDPYLVKAVIKVESNFNSEAVSPKGAMGVMQLMPGTAKDHGVNEPFDPADNIKGGVKYLKRLMEMFKGNLELALAGYNAGENAVIRYGYKIPPYNETMNYVEKVLSHYDNLRNNPDEKEKASKTEKQLQIEWKSLDKHIPAPLEIIEEVQSETETARGKVILASAGETLSVEPVTVKQVNRTEPAVPSVVNFGKQFTVQVASFPEMELAEAKEMEQYLKSKAYPAFIQKAELPDKGIWYRVRLGRFSTMKEAEMYGEDLRDYEPRIESLIVMSVE